jgi:hypothetical protein
MMEYFPSIGLDYLSCVARLSLGDRVAIDGKVKKFRARHGYVCSSTNMVVLVPGGEIKAIEPY